MITAPRAASPAASHTFETLLETAMKCDPTATRGYALDHGVDEPALVRYTNGAVGDEERQSIEFVVARNRWSREYIVDLVKSRRSSRVAA